MGSRAEISSRIERLVTRVQRRDDYGTLLASGHVVRDQDDVDAQEWRSAIRRQARADQIKVRTGKSGSIVWAMLPEAGTEARSAESERYRKALRNVVPRAVELRHEPLVLLRDADEALLQCQRCEALGYVDAAKGPLVGGLLVEQECPDDEPPKQTALTWMY
jgi:hypothetical protein